MKKEDFILKAKLKHNDKYNYDLLEPHFLSKDKVSIVCPVHGTFDQYATVHLAGSGCRKCSTSTHFKLDKDIFTQRSKDIHGEFYDYSKVNYVKNYVKVEIICPKHGSFMQKPCDHMIGRGCVKCSAEKRHLINKMPLEVFIDRSNKVHNYTYDYSKVVYKNVMSNVTIICPEHGEFSQQVNTHLSGCGCPTCAALKVSALKTKGKDFYLSRAKEYHGNKYDYSLVVGETADIRVTIICPEHGEFICKLHNHSKGQECPECNPSGYNIRKAGTFYILKVTDSVGKFGISNKFSKRLQQIVNQSCFDIETLHTFNFEDGHIPRLIESTVIASDIQKGVVNRCDMNSGYSETFYLKDLSKILEIVDNFTNDLSG